MSDKTTVPFENEFLHLSYWNLIQKMKSDQQPALRVFRLSMAVIFLKGSDSYRIIKLSTKTYHLSMYNNLLVQLSILIVYYYLLLKEFAGFTKAK